MKLPWQAIRREEWRLTGALAIQYFLVIGVFTLSKIARDSLFLAELPASYLPYVYVGLAALSIVVVGVLARLNVASHRRLLGWIFATTAVVLVMLVWLAAVAPRATPILLYLYNGSIGTMMIAEFWLLANQSLDTRQARRIFGVVGAAGVLGGLAAGAAATVIGPFVGAKWFLLGGAVMCAMGFLGLRHEAFEAAPTVAAAVPGEQKKSARGGLEGNRYVFLLIALFLLVGVTASVLDYAFKVILQAEVTDEGRITSLLGVLYSLQNVAALVTQLGLTGIILSRFGSRPAANALPVGLFLGTVFMLGVSAAVAPFVLIGTRLYEAVMRTSLARTAWEFLYYPMNERIKQNAKRFIEVVVNRAADALAGGLLLLLNFVLGGSLAQIGGLLVGLLVLWLLLEFRLNRAYAGEISRSLERMVPPDSEARAMLRDIAEPAELAAMLASEDENRVLYAIGLLETLDPSQFKTQSARLLRHPAAGVRERTLAVLMLMGEDADRCRELLLDPIPEASPYAEVEPLIEVTAAQRIFQAARPDIAAKELAELLEDPSPDVRTVAYHNAGLGGRRELLPIVIAGLTRATDRNNACRALALYGNRAAGTLGDYLTDPATPPALLRDLAAALVKIGTQDAAYSLYRATRLDNDLGSVELALESLLALRDRNPEIELPSHILRRDLRAEIERYAHSLLARASVREAWGKRLQRFVRRIRREHTSRYLECALRRLALAFPGEAMATAVRGIRSADARVRAQAIEYLDGNLSRELKSELIPLLDARSDDERASQAALILKVEQPSPDETLDAMLESEEPWLNACALYVIGAARIEARRETPRRHLQAADPIVRDTAQWADLQLSKPGA